MQHEVIVEELTARKKHFGFQRRNERLSESELYKELGILTKEKSRWEKSIPYVSSLLSHESVKIQAKALWLLGEMGLQYPEAVEDAVPEIAVFCDSSEPLLRERAINALGRIGNLPCPRETKAGICQTLYRNTPRTLRNRH